MRKILCASLIMFSLSSHALNNNSDYKEYDGIAAIVNGDIITFQDLEKRVVFTLFSTGGNITGELRLKVYQEVLKEMIQENLKWQCTQKFAPKNGWVATEAVESAFSDIAKRNNLNVEAFCDLLKSNGVDKDVLKRQIRVNLAWVAYINARFSKFVAVSESEVRDMLAQMKKKQDQESYHVFRMFFPVNEAKDDSSVLSHVNNLKQMLTNGANFSDLARQFSKSPEASNGGEIGVIFQGQLSAEEDQALSKMAVGSTVVVRTNHGYVILFLQDKKEAGLKEFTTVELVQVVLPFSPDLDNYGIEQLMGYMTGMKKTSASCIDFIKKAKNFGRCGISDPINTILERMPPQFRNIVSAIPSGGIGNPVVQSNAVIVFCVLNRKTQKISQPTAVEVQSRKIQERLGTFADREMHDLKKKSEIKINDKYSSNFIY